MKRLSLAMGLALLAVAVPAWPQSTGPKWPTRGG